MLVLNNVAVRALQIFLMVKSLSLSTGKRTYSHIKASGFVPGITHRLGLPALKVGAPQIQFVIEQDDKTLRTGR